MRASGIITAALLAAAPAMGSDSPTPFIGHWQVAGVAVSDAGAQALTNDDPSFMGERLAFTPRRLGWDKPTSTGDACVGPRFTRLPASPPADLLPRLRKLGIHRPVAYGLRCRSGIWGPGDKAEVYLGVGGAIAMPWYDGSVLKLVR